jgi:hypothetical protein
MSIAGCWLLGINAAAPAQPVDANMDRILAEHRTAFPRHMNAIRQQASELFRAASLAAKVCDKERLEQLNSALARVKRAMEDDQSSWLHHPDFDPNLWGYVHNSVMHEVEQTAAWLRVNCTFPNVSLADQPPSTAGSPAVASGQSAPDIADDIDWWNRQNHEDWFVRAEELRTQGLCAAWRAQLDAIERELRRLLRNPTGPVDELEARVAAWQRLWRYLMAQVRSRPCPPSGTLATPEQRLLERRARERAGASERRPMWIDQVPHRSGPSEQRLQPLDILRGIAGGGPSSGDPKEAGNVQSPTGAVRFPTVPRYFCSEEERQRFVIDVINPEYLRAAENAEAAARRRTQIDAQINEHVQAGRAVPAELAARRREAAAEFAAQQRLSDEIARLRDRARQTPVIDCRTSARGSQTGQLQPGGLGDWLSRASSRFNDARERCDRKEMADAIRELERLLSEARQHLAELQSGIQDERYLDDRAQQELSEAETDVRWAERLLAEARARQASCPRPSEPPPEGQGAERGQPNR